MRIDLHTHSVVSDGTDDLAQLIEAARLATLDVIAVSDHDTMAGVDQAQALGDEAGVTVLRAVEISTHLCLDGRARAVHLLGYGPRPDDQGLADLLARVRQSRQTRLPQILAQLDQLGLTLDQSEVEAQSQQAASTGRPHVADAMVARGYVASRDEAFQRYLYEGGPAYVERFTPTVAEAIAAVNRAGGVAVLAHPWGRGNQMFMTGSVIATLVKDSGLFGLEVDHVDHSADLRRELGRIADDLGLVATGSSDYHGTGKTRNPLGICLTDPEVYHQIRDTISERGGQP